MLILIGSLRVEMQANRLVMLFSLPIDINTAPTPAKSRQFIPFPYKLHHNPRPSVAISHGLLYNT